MNMTDDGFEDVGTNGHVIRLAGACNSFGFALLAALIREHPRENIFFSPYSISTALTLALNGAQGNSLREIAKVLGIAGMPLADINAANRLYLGSLSDPDPEIIVSCANALWVDHGMTIAAEYQEVCQQFYSAAAKSLDFSSPIAAQYINDWVYQQTRGEITDMVSPSGLLPRSMVITNALHFRGNWAHKFDNRYTVNGVFTLEDGATKTLPMMSATHDCSYSETDHFQSVRLPYGQGRLALYIVLPKFTGGLLRRKAGINLDTIMGQVAAIHGSAWMPVMDHCEVSLVLPRFKVGASLALNDALISLGMDAPFVRGSDFTPMGIPDGLIGNVLHKAILDVDESGTVAAAATAMAMAAGSLSKPKQVSMRVDRPFFLAIRDDATGAILFMGVIRDPQQG